MPLPDDFTEEVLDEGGIRLVYFQRDPRTIQPRGACVLAWLVDAGPLNARVEVGGISGPEKGTRTVTPTFTRSYDLDVSVEDTAFVTLATRTVNVDLSDVHQVEFPLSDLREPLRAEVRALLDDNGFGTTALRSVRLSGRETVSEQDEGVLDVTLVLTYDALTVTLVATYGLRLGDGAIVGELKSAAVEVEAGAWLANLVSGTPLGPEAAGLAGVSPLVGAVENFLEGVLGPALASVAEDALGGALDAAVEPLLGQLPAGIGLDALYALTLGTTVTAYLLVPPSAGLPLRNASPGAFRPTRPRWERRRRSTDARRPAGSDG